MKKLKVIARGAIYNNLTKKKYTDAELQCENLYFEDVLEVVNDYNECEIIFSYEKQYPRLKGWTFQIVKG
ncbi:MAG: hypothetical protein IJX03_00425 [Clostridia bacterium]|nr:hypothetical protein [Clostridia bacterium]